MVSMVRIKSKNKPKLSRNDLKEFLKNKKGREWSGAIIVVKDQCPKLKTEKIKGGGHIQ